MSTGTLTFVAWRGVRARVARCCSACGAYIHEGARFMRMDFKDGPRMRTHNVCKACACAEHGEATYAAMMNVAARIKDNEEAI